MKSLIVILFFNRFYFLSCLCLWLLSLVSQGAQLYMRFCPPALLWGCCVLQCSLRHRDVRNNLELRDFYALISTSSHLSNAAQNTCQESVNSQNHCKRLHVSFSVCLPCDLPPDTSTLPQSPWRHPHTFLSIKHKGSLLSAPGRRCRGNGWFLTAVTLNKPHEWIMNFHLGRRMQWERGAVGVLMTVLWSETSWQASGAVFIQEVNNIYYLLPGFTSITRSEAFPICWLILRPTAVGICVHSVPNHLAWLIHFGSPV